MVVGDSRRRALHRRSAIDPRQCQIDYSVFVFGTSNSDQSIDHEIGPFAIGVLDHCKEPIEAFFEPFVSFARYLPASAFIPLLILWAGIGELQKLLVIFIGSVFQIVLMVAVTVATVRRDLVEAAMTLGARDRGILTRVLIPASAPDIAEILRLVLGWAWTYVIVAELIGSSSGIGHMITDSQALLATGQIIFGIIVIGVIGLISDFLFKWGNRQLFPWSLA